jgi:hypothetical protein
VLAASWLVEVDEAPETAENVDVCYARAKPSRSVFQDRF